MTARPRPARRVGRLLLGVAAAVILVATATLGGYAIAVAVWRAGLTPPPPGPPGTAVVFFDATVETTLPRALHALDLVRRGAVDRVLLVGGARPARGFFGSTVLRARLAGTEGFEGADWIADAESFDTPTNLQAAAALLKARPTAGPVLFVSDDYHLWRIARLCPRLCVDPVLADRIVWSPTTEPRTLADHLGRLTWEIGAWLAAVLPEGAARWLVWATRS